MVGYLEKAWKTVASHIDDTHAHTCTHTVVSYIDDTHAHTCTHTVVTHIDDTHAYTCTHTVVTRIGHTLVCLHGQCESVRFISDIEVP